MSHTAGAYSLEKFIRSYQFILMLLRFRFFKRQHALESDSFIILYAWINIAKILDEEIVYSEKQNFGLIPL